MKTKIRVKLLTILTSFALLFSMLPMVGQMAYAAGDTKALRQISCDYLKGAQAENIYFGKYPQSKITSEEAAKLKEGVDYVKGPKGGFYLIEPIKWRIIYDKGPNYFLLSDRLLDVKKFNDEDPVVDTTWETCSLRTWLNTGTESFYSKAFSDVEKARIAETEVKITDIGNQEKVVKDNLFLLAMGNVRNTDYGFENSYGDSESRVAETTDYYEAIRDAATTQGTDQWWLRSPGSTSGTADFKKAAYCGKGGGIFDQYASVNNGNTGVRPAMNIAAKDILFQSLAEGVKDIEDGKITAVGESTTCKDWRITFKDSARSGFKAEERARTEDGSRRIYFSGAKFGQNEYLSLMLRDKETGVVTHYGRVLKLTKAEGWATVDLKSIDTKGKDIYVFNEHYEKNKATDYASALVRLKGSMIAAPTAEGPFVYDGKEKTGVKAGEGYTLSGATATNAGSYEAIATLEEGYIWADRTADPKTIEWKIQPALAEDKAVIPTPNNPTYNGEVQTGVEAGRYYILSGTTTATNAGTYTATATLDPNYICEWTDRTTEPKTITWKINKAANPLAIKAKTATVKGCTKGKKGKLKKTKKLSASKVIAFKKKGQGKLKYNKIGGNKKIAINKTSGKVTVKKGIKKGTYKVKVKVMAAGNINYEASKWKTVTFSVKVK